ncbi:MAG TPA: thermostable hemolysin, partial [Telmatospirillum sp.]|nr:thermostable hemolysin [Telmatospirillum sp.]
MFEVVGPKHRLRPVVETCIRAAFRRDHGAQVGNLPRCLVADIDGARVTCAASLRFAEDGFFSERYLDEPIERLVTRHAGAPFDRTDVAEVGSLAAVQPGKVRDLVRGIIPFLQARDMHWAFFTATARLRIF